MKQRVELEGTAIYNRIKLQIRSLRFSGNRCLLTNFTFLSVDISNGKLSVLFEAKIKLENKKCI